MTSIFFYIFYICLALISTILFTVVFALTYFFDSERKVLHSFSRVCSKIIYNINPWWRVSVEGKENLTKDKAYVVVTNHQSMFDIPIMYFVHLNFKWVSKKEVLKWPFFGWMLLLHGDILIKRGTRDSMKILLSKGIKRLDRGTSVIIFPEGTRSRTGKVGNFKDGAFILAKESGRAILPCKIEGTRTMLKGWRLVMPHKFTITIMPEVSESEVKQTEVKDLRNKVRELYN
ncbi:MAG: lysophospholipid acyltransferase family protein [Rikenellaceae bacterium]